MHLIQAGVNLIYIRDLLGHADVSTTEIYARGTWRPNAKQSSRPTSHSPRTSCRIGPWTRP